MPLAELKRTLVEYPLAPKARFLIEYVLIKGVNDSLADADAVIDFCRGLPCIVNLIPYNPQRFAAYETPEEPAILAFLNHLKERGNFIELPRHAWARADGGVRAARQSGSAPLQTASAGDSAIAITRRRFFY